MNTHLAAVLYANAQRLAANGQRDAALQALDKMPPGSGVSALRAKVLCQLGRFAEGAKAWREVLQDNPADQEAQRGLVLAERWGKSAFGRWVLYSRHIALTAVILVAVFLAALAVRPTGPSNRDLAAELSREREAAARMHSDSQSALAEVSRRFEAAEKAEAKSLDQMKLQLQRLQQAVRGVERSLSQRPRP